MENKEETLKAKLDFSKTIFVVLFAASMTSLVGSVNIYGKNNTYFWMLFWMTIVLMITSFFMFKNYDKKHNELINFLK